MGLPAKTQGLLALIGHLYQLACRGEGLENLQLSLALELFFSWERFTPQPVGSLVSCPSPNNT